jgi:AcrR family transcriptional regulator
MPQRTRTARKARRAQRLSRNQWLSRALDLVAREGGAKLHIETLCRQLRVTRGSFYWHFRSRSEFVQALVEYWGLVFTRSVVEQHRSVEGSPEERLLSLMELLHEGHFARYDVAVRAWAAQEPSLAAQVARVDEERLAYVGSLFAEMGFRGDELDMRTRLFVVFHSLEHALPNELPGAKQRRLLRRLHALLTRR